MASIIDDRGFNQGFELVKSTRVRMQRRTDYMISLTRPTPSRSVLEIGCGTGEVSYWLADRSGMQVLGTDLCVPFIEQAKQNYRLANLRYDVLDFNKADQFQGVKFDYIVGNGILHHLYHHLDEVFLNMKKLLKPKGKIIFIEPNIYNPYCFIIFNFARKWANLEPDEMAFSKTFISGKLAKAGYSNIKVEYKDFLLPGIPDALITPSIVVGDVLEKVPLLNMVSQSIFISAEI
jgi:2-polyprenyl-3-methyl-5-hydroxy-6-metoxy-1,4-benzoquinol methylase